VTISADVAKGLFGGILAIEENMIVCGYQVHAKFQLFRWNGEKYIEYMRCRLKKSGETKHFIVTNLKKSKLAKYQFYCNITKDVCRVTLDFEAKTVDWNRKVHPKDTLFRGEVEVVDY
jgi:hypothetical protein